MYVCVCVCCELNNFCNIFDFCLLIMFFHHYSQKSVHKHGIKYAYVPKVDILNT